MCTLEYFNSILNTKYVKQLKEHKINTVVEFLQENPGNLCKITKLHFKDVLEIKQKLLDSFRKEPCTLYDIYNEVNCNSSILPSGIAEIDEFIGKFESGNIYEICGLSGTGKTQICLTIAANITLSGKCVHYIDTKGDFSAKKIFKIISAKEKLKQNIVSCMERVKVTKITNFHQLISVLHWLKVSLIYSRIPLVIIDCVSTLYFTSVGSDTPIGLALLSHAVSLMKYLTSEYHTVILITNLATKSFKSSQEGETSIKPCIGKYWFHVCDTRLMIEKKNNTTNITVSQSHSSSLVGHKCNVDIKIR